MYSTGTTAPGQPVTTLAAYKRPLEPLTFTIANPRTDITSNSITVSFTPPTPLDAAGRDRLGNRRQYIGYEIVRSKVSDITNTTPAAERMVYPAQPVGAVIQYGTVSYTLPGLSPGETYYLWIALRNDDQIVADSYSVYKPISYTDLATGQLTDRVRLPNLVVVPSEPTNLKISDMGSGAAGSPLFIFTFDTPLQSAGGGYGRTPTGTPGSMQHFLVNFYSATRNAANNTYTRGTMVSQYKLEDRTWNRQNLPSPITIDSSDANFTLMPGYNPVTAGVTYFIGVQAVNDNVNPNPNPTNVNNNTGKESVNILATLGDQRPSGQIPMIVVSRGAQHWFLQSDVANGGRFIGNNIAGLRGGQLAQPSVTVEFSTNANFPDTPAHPTIRWSINEGDINAGRVVYNPPGALLNTATAYYLRAYVTNNNDPSATNDNDPLSGNTTSTYISNRSPMVWTGLGGGALFTDTMLEDDPATPGIVISQTTSAGAQVGGIDLVDQRGDIVTIDTNTGAKTTQTDVFIPSARNTATGTDFITATNLPYVLFQQGAYNFTTLSTGIRPTPATSPVTISYVLRMRSTDVELKGVENVMITLRYKNPDPLAAPTQLTNTISSRIPAAPNGPVPIYFVRRTFTW